MNLPIELEIGELYSLLDGEIIEYSKDTVWSIEILGKFNIALNNNSTEQLKGINIYIDHIKHKKFIATITDDNCNKISILNRVSDLITEFINDTIRDYTLEEYAYVFTVIASTIDRIINSIENTKLCVIPKSAKLN